MAGIHNVENHKDEEDEEDLGGSLVVDRLGGGGEEEGGGLCARGRVCVILWADGHRVPRPRVSDDIGVHLRLVT